MLSNPLVFYSLNEKSHWIEHDNETVLEKKQSSGNCVVVGDCDEKRNEKTRMAA